MRAEYEELRRLPFVEPTPDGLRLHDVVHEVVAADLADRDPERTARYRRRAWRSSPSGRAGRRPSASGRPPPT